MKRRIAPFRDPNFKLAVIQALYELGEFRPFFKAIKRDRRYAWDGPYFAKAKRTTGPHPEVLARFLDLKITAAQLKRVKRLTPDGGDETYMLIAPNWEGESDDFALKGLADVALLPNLEEIGSFHNRPLRDCSPLLGCRKLRRVVDASNFADEKTLEVLRGRGVVLPKPEPPPFPYFDRKQPRALVFELRELRKGFPKPAAFKVSKRIQQRPFFFYDVKFEKRAKLPKEVEFPEAESARGYAFCAKILDALGDYSACMALFDTSGGEVEAIYGWHATASREEVTAAFKASGFEVYPLAFVYEHD